MKNAFGRKIVFFLCLLLLLFLLGFEAGRLLAAGRNGFQTFLQVLETIKTQYVKKDLEETKLFYGAIKGLVYSLNDPYTRFLEPKAYTEMKVRMRGTFGGIGIQIGIRNDLLTIIAPIENTPAWRAGLRALDQILAIDDEPTFDMSIEEAVQKIRGAKGTKVKLKILRKSFKKPKDFEIIRDVIMIEDLKKTIFEGKVGYIRLITFENEKSFEDLRVALNDLKTQGLKGLILDLRNNGGGLLQNALDISSLFLEKGRPIVATIDRHGRKETFFARGGFVGYFPMVVLVNEGSASASEILAGAIKDNRVGTVVGQKTFGKASVQTIKPLWDGSALLYTIAKYLTPNGGDITEKGIEPEVVINSSVKGNGESEDTAVIPAWPADPQKDPALQKALEIVREKIKNSRPVNQVSFLDTFSDLTYIKLTFFPNFGGSPVLKQG